MTSFFRCLFLLLPLALVGCESMTPSECATANWHDRGMQDGQRGQSDRIASYYESCTKAGFRVDANGYRAGRSQGLLSYCRLDNAVNEGLGGRSYGGVCQGPLDQSFRIFHEGGYRVYEAQRAMTRVRSDQEKWQAELRDKKTADDRKETLRGLLSRSDRRIEEARDNLRLAESRLEVLRNDLRRRGPR